MAFDNHPSNITFDMNKYSSIIVAVLVCWSASAGQLKLTLHPAYEDRALALDSLRYSNDAGQTYSISRLSLFLSDFTFQTSKGHFQSFPDSVAWFDVGKRETSLMLPNIPDGAYTSIHFKVGLSEERNKSNPWIHPANHPLNPNVSGLYWNWQGGYIFTAIEGLYREAESKSTKGFSYHFANNHNLTPITIHAPIRMEGSTEILLNLSIDQLLNGEHLIDFVKLGNSTHSRPGDPIATALKKNFESAFSIQVVQSLFPEALSKSNVEALYLPDEYVPAGFNTSRRFPIPGLPKDNPLIQSRVDLGETLFHDKRLSADQSIACASCHRRDAGLSDPNRFSTGVENRKGKRQSMPLFNLAWKNRLFWDGRAATLREQVLIPIQDHLEMDMQLETVVARLQNDKDIQRQFEAAFGAPGVTTEKIALALENFLLTLTSYDSKFDRVLQGKATFTAEEKRGFELFVTENEPRSGRYGADCFHCHGGPLLTDHGFHNNGLDAYPKDVGLRKTTGNPADNGKFATPSLRNIALTAPYMHDGRFETLEEIVEHYSSGIQPSETLDPNLAKHARGGLGLSEADQAALVAFLKTLTDPKLDQTGDRNQTIAATQ
jgi:cytochrome c peroxidase